MRKVQHFLIQFGEKLGTQMRGLPLILRKIIFIPVTPVQHGRERKREREIEHLLHACVTSLLTKMQNKLGYDIRGWDLHTWFQLPISSKPHAKLFKDNQSKLKIKTEYMERGLFFSFLFSVLTSWWIRTFSINFLPVLLFYVDAKFTTNMLFPFYQYYLFFFFLLNLLEKMLFPF